jgi:hypothetical protein
MVGTKNVRKQIQYNLRVRIFCAELNNVYTNCGTLGLD